MNCFYYFLPNNNCNHYSLLDGKCIQCALNLCQHVQCALHSKPECKPSPMMMSWKRNATELSKMISFFFFFRLLWFDVSVVIDGSYTTIYHVTKATNKFEFRKFVVKYVVTWTRDAWPVSNGSLDPYDVHKSWSIYTFVSIVAGENVFFFSCLLAFSTTPFLSK